MGRRRVIRDDDCALIFQENSYVLLPRMHAAGIKVDLVYLDPPFMSQQEYKMPDGRVAFDDRWHHPKENGWTREEATLKKFINTLRANVSFAFNLLQPHGSIVVHINPSISHYVKVMMDEEFGRERFVSEIVWRYRRWPSATPNYQRIHDVILRYRKDMKATPRWNQHYEPLAPSTLETWGTQRQQAMFDEEGNRSRSIKTGEESKGVPLGDVWDISIPAPSSKERTGYPTQKPEALLDRIVATLSNPGDIVLDPYMGSGTTLVSALSLKRRAIGIDASPVAIEVAERRLRDRGLANIESREAFPRDLVAAKLQSWIPTDSPRQPTPLDTSP